MPAAKLFLILSCLVSAAGDGWQPGDPDGRGGGRDRCAGWAGADGLVIFNRFYQPDFDLDALEVVPNLVLSDSSELRLRLHWAALLYNRIRPDIAITGGVHTAQDVLKSMMAGAQVVEIASAILKNGIGYLKTIENDLIAWMVEHEYESIRQMRGSLSRRSVPDASPFERGNYIKTLSSNRLRQTTGAF